MPQEVLAMTTTSSRATHKRSSQQYVALLRGINLGNKNKLSMKELSSLFSTAGCSDVQTYIQSGNVVFTASRNVAGRICDEITGQLMKRFGLSVPVILRSSEELREALYNNPFLKMGAPEEILHLMFLAELPSRQRLESLDPERSPGDTFLVRGREIYLRLPNGVGRSKLTNAYFDSKLDTTSTSRNWLTVKTLCEMCGSAR
jgi:uncharacterized protein (DUF1697 family)